MSLPGRLWVKSIFFPKKKYCACFLLRTYSIRWTSRPHTRDGEKLDHVTSTTRPVEVEVTRLSSRLETRRMDDKLFFSSDYDLSAVLYFRWLTTAAHHVISFHHIKRQSAFTSHNWSISRTYRFRFETIFPTTHRKIGFQPNRKSSTREENQWNDRYLKVFLEYYTLNQKEKIFKGIFYRLT